MLDVFKIFILTGLNFFIVKCSMPDLSVQTLDKRLIDRKRQDTLDMCRIFNAETEKLNTMSDNKFFHNKVRRRYKRHTGVTITKNEIDNAKRVESIVDKFYEDLEENGERVTYRQRNLNNLTTVSDKDLNNKTMRRANFAPAELLGPRPTTPESSAKQPVHGSPVGLDWPKRWKHGIVPYFIDSKTYDTHLADGIMKAFDYFEKATCIRLQRLKDRPTDRDSLQNVEWLYISNPSGIRQCVHSNEQKFNKGVQMVVFGYSCMSLGEIVHEVMHILGFSHEHTRPDRDQHVTILWNNIKPGYKKYFEARSYDPLSSVPYDYASVIHYPSRAFSKNGQLTIMAEPGTKLGQREGLSDGDVQKVGIIYGNECVERNRQYLLKTCPSVVKADPVSRNVTQNEIKEYFKERVWPYGVITYKLRDQFEFSAEERENIKAVIRHIEKETCIEFKDYTNVVEDPVQSEPDWGNDDDNGDDSENRYNENTESETTHPPSSGDNNHVSASENNIRRRDAENEIIPKEDIISNTLPQTEKPEVKKGLLTNTTKASKPPKTRKSGSKSLRRHAADILELARSVEPGCACPPPGKPKGNKILHINADCFNSVNDLLHLFVHVLGLDHQHNMHDRDSYLHILWENLTPDIKEEMKVKLPPAASLGFAYDYQSVMHYPWLQIKNGVTNIMYPIWNDGWAMGHWQGLSSTDVFKLNLLYFEQCLEWKKANEA